MKEIEYGDPNFDFLASLLSYGLANDGYTKKQIKYIEKYKKKYQYIWFDAPSSELKMIKGGKNVYN